MSNQTMNILILEKLAPSSPYLTIRSYLPIHFAASFTYSKTNGCQPNCG